MQGRRPKQQHRHVKIPDLTKAAKALKMPIDHLEQPCALFAVYDGHQGHLCAEFAAKVFHMKLLKRLSADTNSDAWTDERFSGVLREICEEIDAEFLAKYRTSDDGCTLVVSLITGARLHVAWIGNCRCLLGSRSPGGEIDAVPVTEDHRPVLEAEAARVKKAGGIIVDFGEGPAGVAHQGYDERIREIRRAQALGLGAVAKQPVALPVTRALGDREFKSAAGKALLIPTPGVRSLPLGSSHRFVALVCGGIPGVMLNEDIVGELDLVHNRLDPAADVRAGCGSLVQEAYKRESQENLTVIAVRLAWPGHEGLDRARKIAAVEKANAAVADSGGRADTAAAASKRRRLEAAATISAKKVAAYERALDEGGAAKANAAEVAAKEAEVSRMKAEVEASKAEVQSVANGATTKAAEESAAAVDDDFFSAADDFFAKRRKKQETPAGDADSSKGKAVQSEGPGGEQKTAGSGAGAPEPPAAEAPGTEKAAASDASAQAGKNGADDTASKAVDAPPPADGDAEELVFI